MAVDLVFRSTDNLKWGPGKDSKLTILEGDTNLWEIQKAIEALQDNPGEAVSIANILVVGSSMQIVMTDASTYTFELPVAAFRYRDEGYVDAVEYDKLDLLPVADQGLYMVMVDHTASGDFDPALQIDGVDVYQLLFGQDLSTYDAHFSIAGKPGFGASAGEPIAMHILTKDAYALTTDAMSLSYLRTASAATLAMDIEHNGDVVGSITFSTSDDGNIVWNVDRQFLAGDELSIIAPSSVDSTAKSMSVVLSLHMGNLPA